MQTIAGEMKRGQGPPTQTPPMLMQSDWVIEAHVGIVLLVIMQAPVGSPGLAKLFFSRCFRRLSIIS
jgi:hypothetical protein